MGHLEPPPAPTPPVLTKEAPAGGRLIDLLPTLTQLSFPRCVRTLHVDALSVNPLSSAATLLNFRKHGLRGAPGAVQCCGLLLSALSLP